MTDVTIPDLPPAGPITGSEVFPGIQYDGDVQFSMAALLALARARATHTGEQAISSVTGLTAALAAKALDAVVVKLTGNQTVAGVKTFSDSPVVPDASWSIAKTTGLQTALDAKALDSAVAHDTGNETWAGVKTFSSSPVVPDLSFSIAKTTGLQAALDAKLAIVQAVNTVATSGAAQTIPDVTVATVNRITLTANCTFTFPTAAAGKSFTVVLVQDGTGSRLATWPASAKWPAATAPTLSTGAGKVDQVRFLCSDGSTWAGTVDGLDIS